MNINKLWSAAAGLAATLLLSGILQAQTMGEPERFTAFAVNMSGIGAGQASSVDIVVDRWSTDAEREKLIAAFVEKGPKELLNQLQKTPRIGYFRLPNTRGYDLHYARQFPMDEGGRRVIIATDRYIGVREATRNGRSMDYPFTLIELRLNKDGEGVGKMSIGTKISLNKKDNTIELETFDIEPVRLTTVKAEKKKS